MNLTARDALDFATMHDAIAAKWRAVAAATAPAPVPSPAPAPAPTSSLVTDLKSVPLGGYVCVYGVAPSPVDCSWEIVSISADKFWVRSAASPLVVKGQTVPVATHTGRVLAANTSDLASVYATVQPGDVIYLAAGTYSGRYDGEFWNDSNLCLFKQGTVTQPIAICAAPGAAVVFDNTASDRPNFTLGNQGSGKAAAYLTISNLICKAKTANIFGGGFTADSTMPNSGAKNVRIVGNTFSVTATVENTMTGMVSVQGDGCEIVNNTFTDLPTRTAINNNHAVYVSGGIKNVYVAGNKFTDLRMGHVIQVHQDGTPLDYQNILITQNILSGAAGKMRGINVGNVSDTSTVTVSDNQLLSLGDKFSALCCYRGTVKFLRNKLRKVTGAGALWFPSGFGGTRNVAVEGNSIDVLPGTPYYAVESGNAPSLKGNSYNGNGPAPAADIAPVAYVP